MAVIKRWKTGDEALIFRLVLKKDDVLVDVQDSGGDNCLELALDSGGIDEVVKILLTIKATIANPPNQSDPPEEEEEEDDDDSNEGDDDEEEEDDDTEGDEEEGEAT